jgi:hypothetical protein
LDRLRSAGVSRAAPAQTCEERETVPTLTNTICNVAVIIALSYVNFWAGVAWFSVWLLCD